MTKDKIIWGIAVTMVIATIYVSYGSPDFSHIADAARPVSEETPEPQVKDTRDLSKYGTVYYNSLPIADPREFERRKQINQRYDKQEWVYKTWDGEAGGVGKITDDPPPPLFPVDESSVILVGEVVMADAFLSNDKEGVYTEFTIRLDDLLKGDSADEKGTKNVVADREGGVVVYPEGQRVLYQNSSRGLAKRGSKYLFFLLKNDQSPNYKIITSYEFSSNGRISQMEMGRSFDAFKDLGKTPFIETVRTKIAASRNP